MQCVQVRSLKEWNRRMGMKVTWNPPELCVEMEKDEIVGSLKKEITGVNNTETKNIRTKDYRY